MEKIYIIEDDENIRNLLKIALEGFGFEAEGFETAEEGLERIRQECPSMAIFDWMLPGMDGVTAIRQIRQTEGISGLPIMLLTAKEKELDKVVGLDCGADDYMVKPAPLPLIEAHVEAIIRRTVEKRNAVEAVGALSIDYEGRKIYLADRPLKVTAKEFDLLEYFIKHKGMILSRDKILDSVWGFDYIGGYRSVDTLVKKLRAKLTKEYPYIKTVYGVGYCFDI